MFFTSWASVARIVVLATIVYFALLAALRYTGARALAKMSAYDLVVTIALGSLIATIPLQKTVTLADGFAAILTYLVLQHAISWALQRWPWSRKLVKERPHVVLWDGEIIPDRLRKIRITDQEVRGAVRAAGKASLREVLCVVLENDGEWSVIPKGSPPDLSALEGLELPTLEEMRRIAGGRPGADRAAGESSGERGRAQVAAHRTAAEKRL